MKLILEENKIINNKSIESIEKANKTIQKQQKEIEELKMKLESHITNDSYRNIKEKSRNNLKEWTSQLESELDHYRQEYTRLHYETTTLKSQLKYNEIEHKRTIEALKLQYDVEISNFQSKLDDLLLEKHQENKHDGQQLHSLQKENSQLQLKIKSLLAELEEVRKSKEKTGLQSDNIVKLQTRQLTENAVTIKTLKSEIESCELQKEAIEKELSSSYENNRILTSNLQSVKNELIQIKNLMEEEKQKFQVELSNIKVENLRNKGKLEREKNELNIEIANLKLDIETVREELEQEKFIFMKREEEWQKQIQLLQYNLWEENQKSEVEKKNQEELLRKSENSKIEAIETLESMVEKLEKNNLESNKTKILLENEIILLKNKLETIRQELNNAEEFAKHAVVLQKEVTLLKQEKLQYKKLLEETQKQLQEQHDIVNNLNHEIEGLKTSINKEKLEQTELYVQQKMKMESEKQNFAFRINELEKQLSEIHDKSTMEIENLREKKQQYGNLINKLRNKLQILETKISELEIENEVLKKNIPVEEHGRLKKQLANLQRKYDMEMAQKAAIENSERKK